MDIKFYPSRIMLSFEEDLREDFLAEYTFLHAEKSIDRYKRAAAGLEFTDGERFLLNVLLDLKKDIKNLREELGVKSKLIKLKHEEYLDGINFSHLRLKSDFLKRDSKYYAKMIINDTLIGFFFLACDERVAKITKMRREDEDMLNRFVLDTQRALISKNGD